MKEEKLVVRVEQEIMGVQFTFWIHRVFNYKLGFHGAILTGHQGEAHQYTSARAARKAATAYNGEVQHL